MSKKSRLVQLTNSSLWQRRFLQKHNSLSVLFQFLASIRILETVLVPIHMRHSPVFNTRRGVRYFH